MLLHPHAYANAQTAINGDINTDGNIYVYTPTNTNADIDTNSDLYLYRHSDLYNDRDVNPNSDEFGDFYVYSNPYCDIY